MSLRERMRAWKGRIASSRAQNQNTISPALSFDLRTSSLHAHPKDTANKIISPKNVWLDRSEITIIPEGERGRSTSQKYRNSLAQGSLQPEHREHSPRRGQDTSQGTVLVSRVVQNQGWAGSDARPGTHSVDELRSEAERGFYEQLDGTGVIRRRSMIRAVSREDHLLGRGANPRTGIVTPGGTNQNNPLLHVSTPQNRNVSAPTKWRQQGDQWISLDAGERTPGNSPTGHPSLVLHKTRRPQGPRQLHEAESKLGDSTATNLRRSLAQNKGSDTKNQVAQNQSPTIKKHLPGAFPSSPEKEVSQVQLPYPSTDVKLPRKPVGSPVSQALSSNRNTECTNPAKQGPQTPFQKSRHDTDRSFSAPGPRRQYFTPAETGISPTQPTQNGAVHLVQAKESSSVPPKNSFLGLRPTTENSAGQSYPKTQSTKKINLDKELPCLPMNSGLSLQPRSISSPSIPNTAHQDTAHQDTAHQDTATPVLLQQPRQIIPVVAERTDAVESHIQTDPKKKPSPVPAKSPFQTNRETGYRMAAIPMYDNPPLVPFQDPTRQIIGGPRAMPQPHQSKGSRSVTKQYMQDPFSTTITNTSTTIPMRRIPGMRQGPNLCDHPGLQLVGSGTMPLSHHQGPRCPNKGFPSLQVTETRDIPAPHGTSRCSVRPQMPSRAIGMRRMPQVNEFRDVQNMTCMDLHCQSRTTGMTHKDQARKHTIAMLPSGQGLMREATVQLVSEESINLKPESGSQVFGDKIVRKCSRCEGGQVLVKHVDTDKRTDNTPSRKPSTASADAPEIAVSVSAQTPEPAIKASESLTSKSPFEQSSKAESTSATVLDVEKDLRDHLVCCPECCKKGCHEACLGHSSPALQSESAGRRNLRRAESSTTLVSSSSESGASNVAAESPGKLSFLKTTLRSPFKHKRSTDMLSTSSKSSSSVHEQSVTTLATAADVDPTLFSGADGASGFFGAVAAAKKAIGFDSAAENQENGLNQFMTPKKRPKSRKTLDPVVIQGTTHLVPAPLRIPGASPIEPEITANESRKLSGSRPCSVVQPMDNPVPITSRTVSNTSGELHMPTMSSMGLKGVWELLVIVPLEASNMWLRNNPEMLSLGWTLLGHVWSWLHTVTATSQLVLNIVYIYSKTGKLKIKTIDGKDVSTTDFLRDCLRSALYLVVLASLSIVLFRTMRILTLPLRFLWLIGRFLLASSKGTTTA